MTIHRCSYQNAKKNTLSLDKIEGGKYEHIFIKILLKFQQFLNNVIKLVFIFILVDDLIFFQVQLLESKVYAALSNLPKARAALTSARTTANSIYIPPKSQVHLFIKNIGWIVWVTCHSPCIIQFSTNTTMKIWRLIPDLLVQALGSSGITKLVLILKFFIIMSAEICLIYDAIKEERILKGQDNGR